MTKPNHSQNTITLTIESLASTGNGVATITENGFKRPVFVRYTVPGDIIEAQITKKNKQYYEARLIKIKTPSPHRRTPCCKHFGTCGACDFLHVSYEQQLASKEQLLRYTLQKADITHTEIDVIPAKDPLHYRTKVRVFAQNQSVGFSARKANTVVPITHCDIIREELNEVFTMHKLRNGEHTFAFDPKTSRVTKEEECFYDVAGCTLAFHPEGFVQSNLAMNAKLINLVLRLTPKQSTVLDLYAGNGNFSVPLAKQGHKVTAVEGDKRGFFLLKKNAEANSTKLAAYCSDIKYFLEHNTIAQQTIILDPPRTGAENIISLLKNTAETLIYVSCNAQALTKELKMLQKQGYEIHSLHLLDLFPQTRHFETVVCLKRKK